MVDHSFFTHSGVVSLKQVGELINTEIPTKGQESLQIETVATLANAHKRSLSFYHNKKYLEDLRQTQAAAVIVSARDAHNVPEGVIALVHAAPYRAFAQVATRLYPSPKPIDTRGMNFHNGVYYGDNTDIADDCVIGAGSIVADNVVIAAGTTIGPHVVIGPGVRIGARCEIGSHVSLQCARIGEKVKILPGTKVGQDGFGFHMDAQGHYSVPQLGRVCVEDHVEIGANVTIDRGALTDTCIGAGSRIDNLVQIGHGVTLGRGCIIVAQVGIAGSTHLGNGVIAAGQVGIAGHLEIGDNVQLAAQTGVMRDIPEGATMAGSPAVPVKQWHRQTIYLSKATQKK